MALSQKLLRLEKVANRLGYKVIPSNKNICCTKDRKIHIDTRQHTITRIYVLAHEIGHAVTLTKCIAKFGLKACKSNTSWASIELEYSAWVKADKLIRKLGLDDKEYIRFKHKCLKSYYLS